MAARLSKVVSMPGTQHRVARQVDAAAAMIEDLLAPDNETRNERKTAQLR